MREQESGYRSMRYSPVVSGPRIVGVVGARSLTYQLADHVGQIVDDLLARGNRIATGGAIGTDEYVLCRLLRSGQSDHCTVFAAKDWKKWFTQHVVHYRQNRNYTHFGLCRFEL